MSTLVDSEVKLPLSAHPKVSDPVLRRELQPLYDSIRILQQELTAAKKRIADLETP